MSFQIYCFYTDDSDMTAIGSLVFCTDCGDLLDGSTGDKKAILICNVCGARNEGTAATWCVEIGSPSQHANSKTLTSNSQNPYQLLSQLNQNLPLFPQHYDQSAQLCKHWPSQILKPQLPSGKPAQNVGGKKWGTTRFSWEAQTRAAPSSIAASVVTSKGLRIYRTSTHADYLIVQI